MNKRWLWLIPAGLLLAGWLTMPPRLEYSSGMTLPPLPAATVIPGSEERVVRAEPLSEWVVVVLHGFSATRQESAPLAEYIANDLGASLVEVRLAGHGLADAPLAGVIAEHWMADAERIYGVAETLGSKLVVLGTSTGATLAAAMLDQPAAKSVHTIVMLSPNFMPRAVGASLVTGPGGYLMPRLIAGETNCWEPANELQARYWSVCYPSVAAVEVMRLVERAGELMQGRHEQDLLVLYSPDDQVVSPDAIVAAYDAWDSPRKQLVEVHDSGDDKDHLLAGDIMSPDTTRRIADLIVDFIGRPAP